MIHRAKRSMGQNFLKNQGVIEKICDTADIIGSDVVFEIGPGFGAITEKLLERAGRVVAVEKDDGLYEGLSEKFSGEIAAGKLELIHGDILKFDTESLRGGLSSSVKVAKKKENKDRGDSKSAYKVVANIPYNLTGAIIEQFLSASFQPGMMVLLVQKEVAERIVAKDKKTGGPGKESILSIAVKVFGDPIYISTVKAGSFVPAPRVDSAIIKIETISRKHFIDKHHEETFFQLVKSGFAHKRKTLAGNLKNGVEPELVEEAIRAAGLRPAARAEDLHLADWLKITNIVYNAWYGSDAQ